MQEKLANYVDSMSEINPDDIIVLDESGADLSITRDYARAEGGARAKASKPNYPKAKFSILGAISTLAIVAILYVENAVNGNIFYKFIKDLLLPHLRKGKFVVMDNVSFHKQQDVIELIESTGAKVVFLPPYSPELSPIEKMWSKIKNILRKLKPRSKEEFHEALGNALNEVNVNDLEAWYEDCGYSIAT